MRDCELSVGMGVDALHPEVFPFEKIRADRAACRFDAALDDRDVETIDAVGRELLLELFARMEILGKNEHPGSLSVEAMHDMDALFTPRAEVGIEVCLRSVLAFAFCSHCQQSVGLQDDDDIDVLMEDRQPRRQRALIRLCGDLKDVALFELPLRVF